MSNDTFNLIGVSLSIIAFLVALVVIRSVLAQLGVVEKQDRGRHAGHYLKHFRIAAATLGLKEIEDKASIRLKRVKPIKRLARRNWADYRVSVRFEGSVNGVPLELLDWNSNTRYDPKQETVVIMPWELPTDHLTISADNGQLNVAALLKADYDPHVEQKLTKLATVHAPFEILVRDKELIIIKSLSDLIEKQANQDAGNGIGKSAGIIEIVHLATDAHRAFHT